jgi:hypothetical protein
MHSRVAVTWRDWRDWIIGPIARLWRRIGRWRALRKLALRRPGSIYNFVDLLLAPERELNVRIAPGLGAKAREGQTMNVASHDCDFGDFGWGFLSFLFHLF